MVDSYDPEIRGAAEAIFDELIRDLVLDTTISAHREIKRGRMTCGTCGTKCRSGFRLHPSATSSHITLQPRPSQPEPGPSIPSSRGISPQPLPPPASESSVPSFDSRAAGYAVGPEKGTGGASGIGSGSGRMDGSGNVFFDCLVCKRAVVSTRYAPHLSSCLGFNGSTRRAASRMASAKARLGTNDRSSPSPYLQGSENGDSDVESTGGKKGRKSVLNRNGKRGGSPHNVKVGKKSKLAAGIATPTPQFPRQALPPSRLGRPHTVRQPNPISLISPVSSRDTTPARGGTTGSNALLGLGPAGSTQSIGDAESGSGHTEMDMDGGGIGEVAQEDSSEGADDDY